MGSAVSGYNMTTPTITACEALEGSSYDVDHCVARAEEDELVIDPVVSDSYVHIGAQLEWFSTSLTPAHKRLLS